MHYFKAIIILGYSNRVAIETNQHNRKCNLPNAMPAELYVDKKNYEYHFFSFLLSFRIC